jgi:DNA-binding transcriptional LysR family regulator
MRLEQLDGMVAFVTVAERGGFSSAARVLGVSPSALSQAIRALDAVRAGDDELGGRLRLSIPHLAVPFVEPVIATLRQKHPGIVVEMLLEDRFVNLVKDGYDAGIRLFESMEKDMIALRIAPPFRFVIVGSPQYFRQRGRPKHPKELVSHDCIGFREMSSGALYTWEFEHCGREFRVPVEGSFVSNEAAPMVSAAERHWGLAYIPDFTASKALKTGRLETVLDDFMPSAPGLFLYFPEGAKTQGKMKALLDVVKQRRAWP